MPSAFTARAKYYANTPEMMARLGAWKNYILGRTGAYGKGVFRNKTAKAQRRQTKERTVHVRAQITDPKTGNLRNFDDVLFVPRLGPIVFVKNGKLAPKEAALIALLEVAKRVKGQGAGQPPRKGPAALVHKLNDSVIDPTTESVVIGTVPLPGKVQTSAASLPQALNEGASVWVENNLLPAGRVLASYSSHPYVESVLEPTQRFMSKLIEQRQAG